MTDLKAFEILAARARGETIPEVDVAGGVLGSIRAVSTEEHGDGPLAAFAGLSLAAASIVGIISYQAWAVVQDPVSGLFSALHLLMQ